MPGSSPRNPFRIAVVGGGISGLAAAYDLARARAAGAPIEEYLIEGSNRLGGALRTERLADCLFEAGADSFLTAKPETLALCEELGLGAQVIGSEDSHPRTWIVRGGELVPLPDGMEFVAPTRLRALARTRLLEWKEKLSVLRDLFVRPRMGSAEDESESDESVADFVLRHFGRGVLEKLVEPLLAAVYGGVPEELSARAVMPRLVELEERHGSLLRALRANKRSTAERNEASSQPLFSALRAGFGELVTALASRLSRERMWVGRPLAAVEKTETGYRLYCPAEKLIEADAVVLALPAWEAARLVRSLDAVLGETLAAIPCSGSVMVGLVYSKAAVPFVPPGHGFLVPRREGLRVRACTFVGQKFRHRVPPERELLRCFLGTSGNAPILERSDEELLEVARGELRRLVRVTAEPLAATVARWPRALPQYTVGHLGRVEKIQKRLADHRGLYLAGNARDGIGVSDCIRAGRQAAAACLRLLGAAS